MIEGFKPDELEAFLRAMFAIAWADREVQAEESVLLREFVNGLGLSDQLRQEVDRWFEQPVNLDTVRWHCLSEPARAYLYLSAVRIAKADHRLDPRESKVLAQMAVAMELPAQTIADIHATESLGSFAWFDRDTAT